MNLLIPLEGEQTALVTSVYLCNRQLFSIASVPNDEGRGSLQNVGNSFHPVLADYSRILHSRMIDGVWVGRGKYVHPAAIEMVFNSAAFMITNPSQFNFFKCSFLYSELICFCCM